MTYLRLFLFFGLFVVASCGNDDDGDARHNEEIMIIQEYLEDNNLTAESTESGLHYIVTKEGNGNHPNVQSFVTVRYKGYLLDGTVFDEVGGSESISFNLLEVIAGWREGIPKFSEGGEGTLLIPSRLAYSSGSLAGETLLFDVELIDVN